MGFVVHTSAFTAHRSAIPVKLWFLGNINSNMGHYNMCRKGVGYLAGLLSPSADFRELAT